MAAELGISRTPLREALKRLAMDALVDFRRTRSAVVAGLTHEDVQQIMELRRLLEIYNMHQLTAADQQRVVHELKQNTKEQLEAIAQNDSTDLWNWMKDSMCCLLRAMPIND